MKNKNGRYGKTSTVAHDHAGKYVAILRELPDIVYEIDPRGYFTFINKAVSILGYRPEEIIGEHFSKIIHPEDAKLFSRHYVLPKYKGKTTGIANAPKLFDERRTGKRMTRDLVIRLLSKKQRKDKVKLGKVIAFGDVSSVGYFNAGERYGKTKFQGTLGIIRDITERRRIEKRLVESQDKYRTLVQGMNEALMQVDNDDRILFINRQISKMLGYTENELLGKIGYKIFFSKADQKVIKKYNGRRLKKLSDKYEIKMKKKSGEFMWVQISGSPVIGSDGNVSGSIGLITDIDQRKHAEEALRRSEEKYRDLVENINDVVYAIDLNGRFNFINPVIESLGGYKPAEVIGKPFADFIDPDHLLFVKRRFQELIDGKEEPAEYKILTRSGEARWIRSFSKPIYKENRLIGIQGIITDIDQRKRMEEKLQYQADMLANVSDAIISTDLGFRIRTWNKAAERIYGWQAWEVIGKPVHRVTRLVYPNDQQNKVVAKFFKEGYWQGEVIQIRKDGTKLDVLTAVNLMRDSSGNPVAVIAVNRDITERKKTENELVNALNELSKKRTELNILTKKIINAQEEERRYLASEIHDEFLQGIVSILYFLQTFDVSLLGKEVGAQKEQLMKAVKDSIEKGRALITETEPIRELNIGLIEAVKKAIALRFSDTAVRIRFIHPKKMPKLSQSVATSVFRIVQEALFNIQRHAKATSVLVKISVNDHDFDIEVRDNGVGFMPELVVRKKTGHYGLLSMQERAHLLGGNLAIISKPGQGAVVKLKFSSS